MPKNLSTNPIDHVHVRKRGKKWAYSFEKARINGQRRKEERTGYATKKDALAAGIEAYTKYVNGGREKVPRSSPLSVVSFPSIVTVVTSSSTQ